MRQFLLFALLCAVLTACATEAQVRYQKISEAVAAASSAAKTCFDAALMTQAGETLSKRFLLDENDPNALTKMSIDEHATSEEKKALIEYSRGTQHCRKEVLENYSKIHPDYVVLLSNYYSDSDQIRMGILKSKITVGKANQMFRKMIVAAKSEWVQIGQRITAQLNEAHRYEMQRRQAAALALQRWSYQQQQLNMQQQMINSINRPTMTNCHYFGSSLNCTTY